jgi:hypothetical protein
MGVEDGGEWEKGATGEWGEWRGEEEKSALPPGPTDRSFKSKSIEPLNDTCYTPHACYTLHHRPIPDVPHCLFDRLLP